MIATICALLIADLPLGPIKQPGTNAHLHALFAAVEQKLHEEDFVGAEKALTGLPRAECVIEWDDSAVTASQRAEFADARDQLLRSMTDVVDFVTFRIGKPGDVKISFVPELPKREGETLRPGAVTFYSPSPAEPRVEHVIALKRGLPYVRTEAVDVANELGFAIMQHFGRERGPLLGELSFRTDQSNRRRNEFSSSERLFVKNTLRTAASLAEAVRAKRRIQPARPKASIDVKSIEGGSVVQGEVVEVTLQITNTGNAPLISHQRIDCGCLWIEPAKTIEPGETALVKGTVDTTEFVGDLRKRYFIITNDPEHPFVTVPVHVYAKPLYRLLMPEGPVLIAGPGGVTADIFLAIDPSVKLTPRTPVTAGLPATATISPWSGVLADPDLKEGAKERSGYRVRVTVPKGMPNGRFGVTVSVPTDHPKFQILRHTFYVQTGIVALPGMAFYGEIGREPRRATVFVSRPGKPFKILKAVSDVPFASATFGPTEVPGEYKVVISLDGNQPTGQLFGSIKLTTDDPNQAVLYVPLGGTVR